MLKCNLLSLSLIFRSQIKWSKNNAVVRPGNVKRSQTRSSIDGKLFAKTSAFVTKKGTLRIKSINVEDAGTYQCFGKLI